MKSNTARTYLMFQGRGMKIIILFLNFFNFNWESYHRTDTSRDYSSWVVRWLIFGQTFGKLAWLGGGRHVYSKTNEPPFFRVRCHMQFFSETCYSVNRAITLYTLEEERVQFVGRSEDDYLSAAALRGSLSLLSLRPSTEQQHCKIAVTPKTTKCRLSHWTYKRRRRNTAAADHRL